MAAREPRIPLSRERVLQAAIALADRDGMESLTMRKLADELGVGAMSLYHHVPNKDALLHELVEIVFSEITMPSTEADWKTAMRRRATSTREALQRHPWAIGLMESRTMPGPDSLRVHNAVLGTLREAGFSIEMTVRAYSVLDAYIYGFALQDKTAPFDSAEESAALAGAQAQAFPDLAQEFPYLAEVVGGYVAKVGYDPRDAFEHGLDLILDALEMRRDTA